MHGGVKPGVAKRAVMKMDPAMPRSGGHFISLDHSGSDKDRKEQMGQLRKLLFYDEIHDDEIPLVTICIAGLENSGKSFLLNYMIRYLEALEEACCEHSLGSADGPLEGFLWGEANKQNIGCLSIWNKVFFIGGNGHPKIGVILIDTKGVFDGDSVTQDETDVLQNCIEFGSVIIYNIPAILSEEHMRLLEAAVVHRRNNLKFAQEETFGGKLLFLIRDWKPDTVFSHGSSGGDIYMKEIFTGQAMTPQAKRTRHIIDAFFEHKACYLMPYPGSKAAGYCSRDADAPFQGKLADLDQHFVTHLVDLFDTILESSTASRSVKQWSAKNLFCTLQRCLEIGPSPLSKQNTTKVLVRHYFEKSIQDAFDWYKEEVTQKCVEDDSTELKKELEKIQNQAVSMITHKEDLFPEEVDALQEKLRSKISVWNEVNAFSPKQDKKHIILRNAELKYVSTMEEEFSNLNWFKNADLEAIHLSAVSEAFAVIQCHEIDSERNKAALRDFTEHVYEKFKRENNRNHWFQNALTVGRPAVTVCMALGSVAWLGAPPLFAAGVTGVAMVFEGMNYFARKQIRPVDR